VAGDVEPDRNGVVLEHEAHRLQWLDDLQPKWTGAEVFHVRSQAA
jgi:hypothetical protein